MRTLRHALVALAALVLLPLLAAAPSVADDEPHGTWPLRPVPEVVTRFDPPTSPYGRGHRGVDLLGHAGEPVRAALAGTVLFAGPLAGRGVVVVGHGTTRTTYEPVAPSVTVGEAVLEGAVLGRLQSTASHCLPRTCLHWGWLRGATYLDPLLLVGAGPVRLLPLWSDPPARSAPLPYAGWRPPVSWW